VSGLSWFNAWARRRRLRQNINALKVKLVGLHVLRWDLAAAGDFSVEHRHAMDEANAIIRDGEDLLMQMMRAA
jgi:hypothetical protein